MNYQVYITNTTNYQDEPKHDHPDKYMYKRETNRVHASSFTMSTSPNIVIIALSLACLNDVEIKIESRQCCKNWSNPASTIQNGREKRKYFRLFEF